MNPTQMQLANSSSNVFVGVNDDRITKEAPPAPCQLEMIAHLNNMGVELVESCQLHEAAQFFRRSLKKASELTFFAGTLAQSTIDNSSASKNLYIYQRGEYDEGMHTFASPILIDTELCSIHNATATILYNLGQVFIRTNDNHEASNSFLRALQIAQVGSSDASTCKNFNGNVSVVAILSNIGNVLYRAGRFDEAIRTFQKALEVGSSSACMGQHSNSHHMLELSSTLNSLGVLSFHLPRADTDKALSYYEESLVIRRKVLGQDAVTKEIATT